MEGYENQLKMKEKGMLSFKRFGKIVGRGKEEKAG